VTRDSAPKGALTIVTAKRDQGQGSSADAGLDDRRGPLSELERRRASLEANRNLALARDLLLAYDRGDLDLDEVAFMLGHVGALLGAAACRGELAS